MGVFSKVACVFEGCLCFRRLSVLRASLGGESRAPGFSSFLPSFHPTLPTKIARKEHDTPKPLWSANKEMGAKVRTAFESQLTLYT
jgi:hypothetical protein